MDKIRGIDIANYLKEKKKKAELEFKKKYLEKKGGYESQRELIIEELKKVNENIEKLKRKMEEGNIEIVLIEEEKLNEIAKKLKEKSFDEIAEALEKKEGETYSMLKERGDILKKNLAVGEDLGKLIILLTKMKNGNKERVFEFIKKGRIDDVVFLEDSKDEERKWVVRLLRRIGIDAYLDGKLITHEPKEGIPKEKSVIVEGRRIWTKENDAKKIEKKVEKLKEIIRKLQVKNAERQIRSFDDKEEKEFQELQKEYLEVRKEIDKISEEFNKEDEVFFIKI